MNKFFILGILILSTAGCKQSTTEQDCSTDECMKQRAYDKVIGVHDEAMLKISYISALKGKIEGRMYTADDSLAIAGWQTMMVDLDAADESMWAWMHQFNSNLQEVSLEEALDYLKIQQEKIDSVAVQINAAIQKAEKALM